MSFKLKLDEELQTAIVVRTLKEDYKIALKLGNTDSAEVLEKALKFYMVEPEALLWINKQKRKNKK